MKKLLSLLCGMLAVFSGFCQDTTRNIAIIPEPVSVTKNSGTFTLPQPITVAVGAADSLKPIVTYLKDRISKSTGASVDVSSGSSAAIKLVLNQKADATLGKEGYKLSVTPTGATITANAAAGLFYGVQTLLQLFPKEIESPTAVTGVKWEAPCVEVVDY